MTIKEIAELTGKTKRCIEQWCEKISQIKEKISQAIKTNIAANFTLEETIEILRAGKISEGIINLLIENANNKNSFANEKVDTLANEKQLFDNPDFIKSIYVELKKELIDIKIGQLKIEKFLLSRDNQKQLPEPKPKLSENEKIINGWLEYSEKTDILIIDKTNDHLRIKRNDLWYLYSSAGGNIGKHEFYRLIDKKFRLLKSNGYDYYTGIGVQ